MKENVTTLITAEAVAKRIKEIAEQITAEYDGKPVTLVCVLKGAVIFMVDLARMLPMPVEFDFMDISSYGAGMESSGHIKINKDLEHSLEGKHVLLVEDIVDSGRTLSHLIKYLNAKNPASLKLCTLLDKPERRVVDDVAVDYVGFVIPDKFVVGYGLDYDQRYRNLPYIGVVNFEE